MPTRRELLFQAAAASALTTEVNSSERTPKYRLPNSELLVSRLAFGTAMISVNWRSPDLIPTTLRALQVAYDNGVNFFDTADTYADGRAEIALGKFIGASPALRAKIVVQSKCGGRVPAGWSPSDPPPQDANYGEQFGIDLSRKHILTSVDGSLKRLRTERLDTLLLHASNALMQPEEVASAFEQLKTSGKVSNFGVSNFNATQIELLRKHVHEPLVANQIQLGLANYRPISDPTSFGSLVDYCQLHNIQVQAYSPLKGSRVLSRPTMLDHSANATDAEKRATEVLRHISTKYAGSSTASIMIAWLLRHPAGIVPIIGASKTEHIVDNCAADRIDLSRDDWTTLFNAFGPIQS